jgi:membrane fusion protein, multidrug efflux system
MNDLRKYVLIVTMSVIGALSVLGFWWQFYTPKGATADREPIAVEVEKVRVGSIVQRVSVTGVLDADNEVTIKPEVEGKIKKLNYTEGALVKEGDALVEIEDASFRAKLKQAEATLKFAKQELERYTKIASIVEFKKKENAESEVLKAEGAYELAKLDLDHTIIRAPFTGYIGLKEFSVGAFVDPRTELLNIVDVDPITVDYHVPATYLRSLSKGQQVKVTIDSFPKVEFKATIGAIDPKVDPLANSVAVRGYIPNTDGRLKPGLFARVNMVVGSKENALLLPETSVLTSGEESYVYKVVDQNVKGHAIKVAVKRPVVPGMSESGVMEIAKGLAEGDLVISVGQSKGIQEGAPVRIVEDVEADAAFVKEVKEVEEAARGVPPLNPEDAEKHEKKPAAEEAKLEEAKDEASKAEPEEGKPEDKKE